MTAAQHQPVRAERQLRDNSPEQIEAMLHVARECSDMESALGPLPPHRLRRYPAPVVHAEFDASAALLWLIVVGVILFAAWAGLQLGLWVLP